MFPKGLSSFFKKINTLSSSPDIDQDQADQIDIRYIAENKFDIELVKYFQKSILGLISIEKTSYYEIVMNEVTGVPDFEEHMARMFDTGKKLGGPCRKQIVSKEKFAYRCIDCAVRTNTLICTDCFENGNHKGHR